MELQFQNKAWDCLRQAAWEVKNEEQTQEIKLPDTMPDVGRVLGAWGQCLVRGKEWRSGGMTVSGGVMVWVLYEPEGSMEPVSVETWVPFQLRWDFPETKRDGSILASCLLQSADARTLSARKLMVRTVVSIVGEALEPCQERIHSPEELPGDVQVLKRTYPVRIPMEAGEKSFFLEENLPLPSVATPVEKIIYHTLQPQVSDVKIMADKAVFRGTALVHMLYRGIDGQLKNWDQELSFSQYTDLVGEYGPDACLQVIPAVTNLELDKQEDGTLALRAGLVGQYVVQDERILEVAEDAYSPERSVELMVHQLQLPTVLENRQEPLHPGRDWQGNAEQCVDVCMHMGQPVLHRQDGGISAELAGSFQLLYRDGEGRFQCELLPWEMSHGVQADENSRITAFLTPNGRPALSMGPAGATLSADVTLDLTATQGSGISMVTGLELGEQTPPDPGRPSLVLLRAGEQTLWEVAKKCGTTVEAICAANALEGEPAPDRILLIPIS